ncbi:MAG: peptidylprolyl isomerase [Patescibacteria group bacterium]|jgi:foldase protein PrsA
MNNPQPNKIDDPEITRLRDVVLKWIEAKKEVRVETKPKKIEQKPKPISDKPTKSKTEKPKEAAVKPKIIARRKGNQKGKLLKIFALLIIICFLVLILFGAGLYQFKWQNPIVEYITKIIPYPAVIVNYQPISYYTWQQQVKTLRNFYNQQKNDNSDLPIPSLEETQKHILDRIIEQELLNQLAYKYNVTVTQTEINERTQKLVSEIGSQESLTQQLKKLYNWTLDQFQKEILEPLVLKNKLSIAVTLDDRINQEARKKAEEILTKLKTGQSFAELAKQYSEDITAISGGDLGYFGKGQMLPEFEQAAFSLKPGETSELVKTQFGYHIIKVEEQLADENGEITQIRARHILIRSQDLDSYLAEFKQKSKIWQFVRL